MPLCVSAARAEDERFAAPTASIRTLSHLERRTIATRLNAKGVGSRTIHKQWASQIGTTALNSDVSDETMSGGAAILVSLRYYKMAA